MDGTILFILWNIDCLYFSKTKRVKYKATINVLKKVRKMTKTPIVAIGGINSDNYKKTISQMREIISKS